MVDLWAMSARTCVQSFVALRCILRKPYGFLENWFQQQQKQQQLEWLFWDPLSGSEKAEEQQANKLVLQLFTTRVESVINQSGQYLNQSLSLLLVCLQGGVVQWLTRWSRSAELLYAGPVSADGQVNHLSM